MFSPGLRRMPPWSSVIPELGSSTVLGCKESHHLVHASLHLPSDNVCFIFITSEDVATESLEAQVIGRIKLCERLAKSRGVVYLKTQEVGHTFYTLSHVIRQGLDESTIKPFLLPLSKAQDLVPVIESFVRDFRAQSIAYAEKTEKLRNSHMLRSLNLLGDAVTHTKINEHVVFGLSEIFPSMAAYSESCMDPNAKERLSATLMMDSSEGSGRRMVDSLVEFWQQNQTL
ncbi:hypothetical protein TWF106_003425 [Orbilia oligospora]|uniref:Uncharacterized protein n=1 Tax=Orbilia oligospora TaxID=2813651 RepID=A0A6G1MD84_ORBOL|nr:hypothetical protein TWF106_003425 [Orbilia oligospora]KAF3205539.1 hypothetical protein TWF679_009299 [Orbilia oligospora]KAF3230680.1 hypothetical protein TWF191_009589 [Orbilia oligospora]KAF3254062.1 hypothetical protein TWF192_003574 [Orbilia oligospora]